MSAGDRDDPARRAVERERADHRRERHRPKLIISASVARALAARLAQHDHGRTWADCRRRCSRANCSVTSTCAFTDAKSDRADDSSWPTKVRSSWTRSRTFRSNQQAKLLRRDRAGDSSASVPPKTMRANVRIISATNANLATKLRPDVFGRIYFSG